MARRGAPALLPLLLLLPVLQGIGLTSAFGCLGLEMRRVMIEQAVQRGHKLTLVCEVDPGGKKIYQAKWYKNGLEFYRHHPGEQPPGKAFPVVGTRVNTDESDVSKVVLEPVDLDTEGRYGCEVTTDYPFETFMTKGNVTVVELPQWTGPRTSSESVIQRDSGELVSINCTSWLSRPAANLTWLINDEKVDSRWTSRYPVVTDSSGVRQTAVLGLDFRLREDHFRHDVVSLKCNAELFDIYYSSQEVKVHRRSLAQHSNPLGVFTAGGAATLTAFPVVLASGLAFVLARTTAATT